jgi:hypothetical protein
MSLNVDGTGTCDRCGRGLPNTGVAYAVICVGMTEDGQQVTWHLCTATPDPCASRVFTKAALAHLLTTQKAPAPPSLYRADLPRPATRTRT